MMSYRMLLKGPKCMFMCLMDKDLILVQEFAKNDQSKKQLLLSIRRQNLRRIQEDKLIKELETPNGMILEMMLKQSKKVDAKKVTMIIEEEIGFMKKSGIHQVQSLMFNMFIESQKD